MPTDAITIATLQNMSEGGYLPAPTDGRSGLLDRPVAVGQDGGRIAALDQYFAYWLDNVEDPSVAFRLNPGIFDVISMHAGVQGAMRKRERSVASLPDRIESSPKAPAAQRYIANFVAEYVRDVWEDIPERHKLYEWMQQAVILGGCGVEWVWHKGRNGERPVSWNPVHKRMFLFDRIGNMAIRSRLEPVWGSFVATNEVSRYLWREGRQPPFGKFMYHTYRREPGTWENPDLEGYNYFGKGEIEALYYPVIFDIEVQRSQLKWLEKYGEPPTALSYPDNDPMNGMTAAIATSLRNEAVWTRPRIMGQEPNGIFDIEQMEVPSASYDAFGEYRNRAQREIDIILLGDSGANQKEENASGGKVGSYGDHESRNDQGAQKYFIWDTKNIGSTINSQLIPAIVWKRFPNLPRSLMPVFTLEPKEEKDRAQELAIIEKASKLGVPVAVRTVYDASGLEPPETDDKTGQKEPSIGGQQPPVAPGVPGAMPAMAGQGPQPGQPASPLPSPNGNGNGNGSKPHPMPAGRMQ